MARAVVSEGSESERPSSTGRRRIAGLVATFAGYAATAALVAAPLAAEQTVEHLRFEDRIGTVPVEVSLTHNGMSTLDTGVLGRLYWEETGAAGFGANVRVTGTPEAGGTLASYASPRFVRTNAAFVSDPGDVATAYGDELRSRLWRRFLLSEAVAALVGGLLLTAVFRGRLPRLPGARRRTRAGVAALLVVGAAGTSALSAVALFSRWDGSAEVEERYPMPGVESLSFSSPQTLEVARQIEPFLTKNNDRTRAGAEAYELAVAASMADELDEHADDLAPEDGERIILAEADPQGSFVGTSVRRAMYAQLQDALGEGVLIVRTISGDITSNGTVAEASFVEQEVQASRDVPVVVVKGDHDTDTTLDQLADLDVANPDLEVDEVAGLDVVAANDPAFKTLFGGVVVNESGLSESEVGENLRGEVGEETEALVVLVHQPATAAGYLGIDGLFELDDAVGWETTPRDDGIPDLPPGIVNVGHLHDAELPKVIWNTDGDEVTWTVVHQLGTSGGVEESPTFNRFSTPFSVPLKTLSLQLQYVDAETGLQTGYATIDTATDGAVTIGPRIDLGLPR